MLPVTPPNINPTPSAPPVQNAANQQNPQALASGPSQALDPNQIHMAYANGLAYGLRRGAMMAEIKWKKRFNQNLQYFQTIAEEVRKEEENSNSPGTPSSSSYTADNEEEREDNEDAEEVEDREASSTQYSVSSTRHSDIYNSDEPASEDERFFNEQLETMRQQEQGECGQLETMRQQEQGKRGQVANLLAVLALIIFIIMLIAIGITIMFLSYKYIPGVIYKNQTTPDALAGIHLENEKMQEQIRTMLEARTGMPAQTSLCIHNAKKLLKALKLFWNILEGRVMAHMKALSISFHMSHYSTFSNVPEQF